MRRVLSLCLPRFATDLLCRNRPDWRDSPLLCAAEAQGRMAVTAVNRPAEAAGLAAGMTLADARAILPGVRVAAADSAGDGAALTRLARWCGRYSPWSAVDSAFPAPGGNIRLDVTGCAHLFGGEAALLDDLARRLADAGYAVRAAIAATPGCAWAAARFGPAPLQTVADGAEREALAPLPAAALRLEADIAAGLAAVGLRRIGDLMEVPRAALAARFGTAVAARLDAALGAAPEPLSPLPPARPHFARLAFAEPVGQTDALARALDRLLETLCAGLEAAGAGARRLVLSLFEPDGTVHRIAVGTSRASRDTAHLARLFAEHLDDVEAVFGIESMTLSAPASEALSPSQPGLAGAAESATGTHVLVDRLSNRLGPARVVRLAPYESHIPERAVRAAPALAPPPGCPAAWPGAPRPLRLLDRPEAIEATAPVPDDPPVLFRWRRVLYRVRHAEGPERIAPEWWRADSAPDDPRLRDYYRVEDMAGRRFWLYREGLYRPDARPAWFLHGLFG